MHELVEEESSSGVSIAAAAARALQLIHDATGRRLVLQAHAALGEIAARYEPNTGLVRRLRKALLY